MSSPAPTPNPPTRRGPSARQIAVWGIIVSAVAAIVAGILAGPLAGPFASLIPVTNRAPEQEIATRVSEANGEPISGAEVLIFFQGGPITKVTDSDGAANLKARIPANTDARVVATKDGYEIQEKTVRIPTEDVIDIRLSSRSGGDSAVIFRVVNSKTNTPINGAEISIIVGADILRQLTDSYGITKFTLKFPESEKLDAHIITSMPGYEGQTQNIAIIPSSIQDIRLDIETQESQITNVTPIPFSNEGSTPVSEATSENSSTGTDISSVCPTTIAFGQTIQCEIQTEQEVDKYIIEAKVDEQVFFRVTRTSETVQPWIKVFARDDSLVCEHWSERVTDVICKMPRSGEYRVEIADSTAERKEIGQYTVFAQNLNAPLGFRTINFGETITGTILRPTKVDTYVLSANAEDRIVFRLIRTAETFQPWIRIYSPDGSQACDAYNERWVDFECVIPRTGNYTVIITDASPPRRETGEYRIYTQRLNFPGDYNTIVIGDKVSGSINQTGQIDTLIFEGKVDEQIVLQAKRLSETLNPWVRVFEPDGRFVCEAYGEREAEKTCTLPRSGRYTITILDASNSRSETGDYEFRLLRP